MTFLILNRFHTLFLCLSYWLWTGNFLLGQMISQTKTLKIKFFLWFNFEITTICVAIRLAEIGIRLGSIEFCLSPSNWYYDWYLQMPDIFNQLHTSVSFHNETIYLTGLFDHSLDRFLHKCNTGLKRVNPSWFVIKNSCIKDVCKALTLENTYSEDTSVFDLSLDFHHWKYVSPLIWPFLL